MIDYEKAYKALYSEIIEVLERHIMQNEIDPTSEPNIVEHEEVVYKSKRKKQPPLHLD